jgi:adenylate kinase
MLPEAGRGFAMLVEFTGLRAVGKTTVAAAVIEALTAKAVPIVGHLVAKEVGLVDQLLALPHRVAFQFGLGAAVVRHEQSRVALDARYTRYLANARLSRLRPGILVLPIGLCQIAMTLHLAGTCSAGEAIQSFAARVPLPDLVVQVVAEPGVVALRRESRNRRGDRKRRDVTAGELEAWSSLQAGLAALAAAGAVQVARVDNTVSDHGEAVTHVVSTIMAFRSSPNTIPAFRLETS